MSRKKYKKRHSQSTIEAKRQVAQAKLADEKDRARKRMDPTARNLLLGDLVFLAICELLYRNGAISEAITSVCSIFGLLIMVIALWFQFGKKKDGEGPSGKWPS